MSARNKIDRHFLILLLGCCFLAALALTLSQQVFVGKAFEMSLGRISQTLSQVQFELAGTMDTLPPSVQASARITFHLLPVQLLKLFIFLGADHYVAIGICVVAFRMLAALSFALLLHWSGTPKWVCFGVVIPLLGASWGLAYGFFPAGAWIGALTVPLFLMALVLLLEGCMPMSLCFLAAHALTHPTTFASWLLVYMTVAAFFANEFNEDETPGTGLRVLRAFGKRAQVLHAVLMGLPLLGGLAVGTMEHAGMFGLADVGSYWDMASIRSVHSLFGGGRGFAEIPLRFLLCVLTLFICTQKVIPLPHKLKRLNGIIASAGLGFYLLYFLCVETHYSVTANMLIPLRIDGIMIPLIIINMFVFVSWGTDGVGSGERMVGRAMGRTVTCVLLFVAFVYPQVGVRSLHLFGLVLCLSSVPKTHALFSLAVSCLPVAACLYMWWAAGKLSALAERYGQEPLYLAAAACLSAVIAGVLLFRWAGESGPAWKWGGHGFRLSRCSAMFFLLLLFFFVTNAWLLSSDEGVFAKNMINMVIMPQRLIAGLAAFYLATGVLCLIAPNACRRIAAGRKFSLALLAGMVIALNCISGSKMYSVKSVVREVELITAGETARGGKSPWAEFLRWHEAHVSGDEQVLVYPGLYLRLIGIPNTSVTYDSAGYSIYTPNFAGATADDLLRVFGIDAVEYAREGRNIWRSMSGDGWRHAQDTFIHPGSHVWEYRWAFEPPSEEKTGEYRPPVPGANVVFENEVVRAYMILPPQG